MPPGVSIEAVSRFFQWQQWGRLQSVCKCRPEADISTAAIAAPEPTLDLPHLVPPAVFPAGVEHRQWFFNDDAIAPAAFDPEPVAMP